MEPHRLVYTGRRWYLLAWDRDREDWRTFRADRILPRLPTGPRFTPREPPEDAATHVVRGTGSLAWRYPARVRLHAPAEVIAERAPPAAGLLRPVDEHSCMLETGGDTLRDLVGYLTSLRSRSRCWTRPSSGPCCASLPTATGQRPARRAIEGEVPTHRNAFSDIQAILVCNADGLTFSSKGAHAHDAKPTGNDRRRA